MSIEHIYIRYQGSRGSVENYLYQDLLGLVISLLVGKQELVPWEDALADPFEDASAPLQVVAEL